MGLSLYIRNLKTLAVELFKVFKGLNSVIFAEVFPVIQQSQYNVRNYSYFAMRRAKTVNHGLESLSYIGSKLWDSIPSHMKYPIFVLMQTLQNLFTKYWIFVVSKKKTKKQNIYVYKNQNVIIVFSRLPYVIHLLFLV